MPVPVSLHPLAEEDIKQALAFSLEHFGRFQAIRYRAMLDAAMERLSERPERGRVRPDIHPQARLYRIATPGNRAAHQLLYRIVPEPRKIQIVRVLHIAMDAPRHWPEQL